VLPIPGRRGLDLCLYAPQQSWATGSRFTRIKLFERHTGEYDSTLLQISDDGVIDVTSGNGVFFAGFLQFIQYGAGLNFERTMRQPSSFNNSIPAFTILDLQWRLHYARSRLEERRGGSSIALRDHNKFAKEGEQSDQKESIVPPNV
jgi:hypothetical protein